MITLNLINFHVKSTVLFTEKQCTFHQDALFIKLCFSLKSIALFTKKHCAFHQTAFFTEKCCTFHWKALHFSSNCTFHWKALHFSSNCAFYWKATKTADSTQISHYDLVFHRVQREGHLGICYILVVFGSFQWKAHEKRIRKTIHLHGIVTLCFNIYC